jgi:hypothetical protein
MRTVRAPEMLHGSMFLGGLISEVSISRGPKWYAVEQVSKRLGLRELGLLPTSSDRIS